MFTFQVIRLTSVVVYMKWFRSKCKDRHGWEAQHDLAACILGSCLHPWVLPPPLGPASIPGYCLAQAAPTDGRGHLMVFPHFSFSSCRLCEWQVPCPVDRERISGKGAITLPLSSVGQPWRGAGSGPGETQATILLFTGPRGVCAWPKDPWHLVLSHVRP